MYSSNRRAAKELGAARLAYTLNPDFGYLNSQVPDKIAFRRCMNGPAGDQTQEELQELTQDTEALPPSVRSSDSMPFVKVEPIEKKNIAPSVYTENRWKADKSSSSQSHREKRPRLESLDSVAIKSEPESTPIQGAAAGENRNSLHRIANLEQEVARLHAEHKEYQALMEQVIVGLKRDLRQTQGDLAFRIQFGGVLVRMARLERHMDELVDELKVSRPWKSDVGSDYDPDATLADFEDGTQPDGPDDWRSAGTSWDWDDEDDKKQNDV
ncbi:hypothetical protein B0H10DRAFT_2245918 [Mycena sp. CBHHK59/15]|nr:hypothetical protein B0H10DRAFT_2245918 [Mycena sp. CBHHK59/15]